MHSLNSEQIMSIHQQCEHPGIKQMLYFTRMVDFAVDKMDVRMVVKRCEACQSIDPTPLQWKKGQLGASSVWQRVGMDIIHYGGNHFLTLIDCGSTYFAIWRLIARQDSSSVICQLSSIFFKQDALEEILTDNDPAFCSQQVKQFLQEWRGSGCDVHMYHQTMASQREAITALRKLHPGNSAPFQRPCIGIPRPRTVHPWQLHLQTPFTGTEIGKRGSILYKHPTRKGVDQILWVIPSG